MRVWTFMLRVPLLTRMAWRLVQSLKFPVNTVIESRICWFWLCIHKITFIDREVLKYGHLDSQCSSFLKTKFLQISWSFFIASSKGSRAIFLGIFVGVLRYWSITDTSILKDSMNVSWINNFSKYKLLLFA